MKDEYQQKQLPEVYRHFEDASGYEYLRQHLAAAQSLNDADSFIRDRVRVFEEIGNGRIFIWSINGAHYYIMPNNIAETIGENVLKRTAAMGSSVLTRRSKIPAMKDFLLGNIDVLKIIKEQNVVAALIEQGRALKAIGTQIRRLRTFEASEAHIRHITEIAAQQGQSVHLRVNPDGTLEAWTGVAAALTPAH